MSLTKKIWNNKFFLVILSFLTTVCLQQCIQLGDNHLSYTNSLFSVVIFGIYLYGILKITGNKDYAEHILSLHKVGMLFSFLLTSSLIVGSQLNSYGYFNFKSIGSYLSIVVLSISFSPFFAWLLYKLNSQKMPVSPQTISRKKFIKIMLLLMLAYIPVLLAVWPGFFCYDAEAETYMVFTNKYSAHHPILHVVMLGWIMRIFFRIIPSYNFGIAVYLLIQMLVVSACFSYMICFLKRIGVRKWITAVGTLFLAFFPTVSMFVCCTTKDVYFTSGLVLFTTLLLELAYEGDAFWHNKKKKLLMALSLLMILLFRNNGVYALVLFLPFFALVYKKTWKHWIKIVLPVIAFYFVFNTAMHAAFHVTPGEKAEMLCVPMQQLARVHEEAIECFNEEDLEIMYSLIPKSILENYNPKLADTIKVNFLEDNFKAEPMKYIKLWLRMGLKRPDIYINSVLMNTYDYWYPDTVVDGYTGFKLVTRYYEDSSYFAFETEPPGARHSLIPFLEHFYEKISLEIYQHNIPVISQLFSMGFWLFTYIFTILYLLKMKYRKQAFAFLPIGFVFFTVLLGPIAIVRYVLYLFFLAPLIPALLFHTNAFIQNNK